MGTRTHGSLPVSSRGEAGNPHRRRAVPLMAGDLPARVLEAAEALRAVIAVPAQVEVVLQRPPLAFILDVVRALQRRGTFVPGLYSSQELDGDFLRTERGKPGKALFLDKLLLTIQRMHADDGGAATRDILAGRRPEATNRLLTSCARLAGRALPAAAWHESVAAARAATSDRVIAIFGPPAEASSSAPPARPLTPPRGAPVVLPTLPMAAARRPSSRDSRLERRPASARGAGPMSRDSSSLSVSGGALGDTEAVVTVHDSAALAQLLLVESPQSHDQQHRLTAATSSTTGVMTHSAVMGEAMAPIRGRDSVAAVDSGRPPRPVDARSGVSSTRSLGRPQSAAARSAGEPVFYPSSIAASTIGTPAGTASLTMPLLTAATQAALASMPRAPTDARPATPRTPLMPGLGTTLPDRLGTAAEPALTRHLPEAVGDALTRALDAAAREERERLLIAAGAGDVVAVAASLGWIRLEAPDSESRARALARDALAWACLGASSSGLALSHGSQLGPAHVHPDDALGSGGLSALHVAARSGAVGVLALLLLAGARPTAASESGGDAPLHLAAAAGNADACDLLIAVGGAHIEPNDDGETPLFAAVRAASPACVCALVEQGAVDLAATDRLGDTAASMARDTIRDVRVRDGLLAALGRRSPSRLLALPLAARCRVIQFCGPTDHARLAQTCQSARRLLRGPISDAVLWSSSTSSSPETVAIVDHEPPEPVSPTSASATTTAAAAATVSVSAAVLPGERGRWEQALHEALGLS